MSREAAWGEVEVGNIEPVLSAHLWKVFIPWRREDYSLYDPDGSLFKEVMKLAEHCGLRGGRFQSINGSPILVSGYYIDKDDRFVLEQFLPMEFGVPLFDSLSQYSCEADKVAEFAIRVKLLYDQYSVWFENPQGTGYRTIWVEEQARS